MGGPEWAFVVIGGPILLGAAIFYALLRNRFQRDQPPEEVSERGARRLYEELDREDAAREKE